MNGVATDAAGTLWTLGGTQLLGFTNVNGQRHLSRRITPAVPPRLGVQGDGERLFYLGSDDKLRTFDPTRSEASVQAMCAVDPGARSFAVARQGLNRGYAARAKLFVLTGNRVSAYRTDGSAAGVVLDLAPPPGSSWYYCALGVEPATGDLLVGSSYPDVKVYRYGTDGKAVTQGGWPRAVFAQEIGSVDGMAWATLAGGGAQSLPAALRANPPRVEPDWTHYATGLAAEPSGGYWVASSQGLSRFDKNGLALHQRLGGLSGVQTLALAGDGTILAGVENGQRQVRLALDDVPDSSLTSNSNEPWRTGAGWTDKACAVVPDGASFLAVVESSKQLWRFDPSQTGYSQTPWVKIPGLMGMGKPRALAIGESHVWILDAGRLMEGARNDLTSFRAVALPGSGDLSGAVALAVSDDNLLALADGTRVKAFTRGADGVYTLRWQAAPFTDVAGLAMTPAGVIVSDRGAATLTLLSSESGSALSRIDSGGIPGGWRPGALAALGRWVVVADDQGARLIRFHVGR
jgi:hypothetical protein